MILEERPEHSSLTRPVKWDDGISCAVATIATAASLAPRAAPLEGQKLKIRTTGEVRPHCIRTQELTTS